MSAPAWMPVAPVSPPLPVQRAIAYLEQHLQQAVSLQELAQVACISRFHLARLFRASTGDSPMQYQRRRRIEQAQRLLREGRHNVTDIACELGYFDQSHFIRSFRAATGCTPGGYAGREQHAR